MQQENNKNMVSSKNSSDEIDIVEIIRPLWLKRKFIVILTVAFLLIGLFVALFSPVQYTSTCTVVPQSSNRSGSSGLGSVASIMGVNLGTAMMSEGALSPIMYPEIVKSVPFTREIMMTEVIVEKSKGESITLFDYYSNKEYRDLNLVNLIKRYTIGLPGVIISSLKSSNETSKSNEVTMSVDSTRSVYNLSSEENKVYKAVQDAIQIDLNSKNGYVVLGYTFPEAKVAAQITDQMYRTLEEYVSNFKSEKLNDNLQFVEQSFEAARSDFNEAQNRLTAFQDANRGLTTASARSMESQLKNEYDIAFTLYRELATQREQAKIAVKENQTILTLVNPPVVPLERSAPRRSLILMIFVFLGFVIACGWVLVKPHLSKLMKDVKHGSK